MRSWSLPGSGLGPGTQSDKMQPSLPRDAVRSGACFSFICSTGTNHSRAPWLRTVFILFLWVACPQLVGAARGPSQGCRDSSWGWGHPKAWLDPDNLSDIAWLEAGDGGGRAEAEDRRIHTGPPVASGSSHRPVAPRPTSPETQADAAQLLVTQPQNSLSITPTTLTGCRCVHGSRGKLGQPPASVRPAHVEGVCHPLPTGSSRCSCGICQVRPL